MRAHRPPLRSKWLDDIFAWREQRRLSRNATLNYRRAMCRLEASEEARKVPRKRVTVHATENGEIGVRGGHVELPATPFSKEQARVSRGPIVGNKLHAGALAEIKRGQKAQATKSPSGRVTLRDNVLLRRQVNGL